MKQAAVPNPLDGLKRTADAAKSAVSSPAPQKVSCRSEREERCCLASRIITISQDQQCSLHLAWLSAAEVWPHAAAARPAVL